jgi:hypothetical protein
MAHGLYVWGVDGLEVEGFVFDKAASATDMFDHFAYIQASNRNVSARNCAFLRGADNQLRAGGYYRDCLFIGMDIGAVIGCGTADENVPGGATIDMKRCAWLGGRKALHLGNIKSGIIEGNLFADGTGEMAHVQAGFAGVQNLTWRNNVRRKWAQGITFAAGMPGPGCSFTQTQERTDLYGVDLSLGSFGFPDLFAALRNRQIAPVDVTTMARQRCGMA